MPALGQQFERLVEILATLRGPQGCPWDKEQTYQDINPYMLEEVHEVLEAIDKNDFSELKEELGDLMMHICFHSQLAKEDKHFSIGDVLETQCEKLIRRHPHVFGNEKAPTSKKVLENWEKIKAQERDRKQKENPSLLSGLPKGLPALVRALRLGEKTSRVGFDWPDPQGVFAKVNEEWAELKTTLQGKNLEAMEYELGDLLLATANLARHLKIDPETALRKACERFARRFEKMEKKISMQNRKLQDLTAEEWEALWKEAKFTESADA